MKYISILFSLVWFNASLAQDYVEKKPKAALRHFQICGSFSTNIAFRTLKVREEINIYVNAKTRRDENEIPRFAYQSGISFSYFITRNVGVETGIMYSRSGYMSKWIEDDPNPEIEKWNFTHNFEYVDVPLLVSLRSNHDKVRFIASLGLVFSHLVRENYRLVAHYTDESVNRITENSPEEFNSFNLSGMFGFGIDVPFGSRFGFQAKPNFSYGFLRIIDAPLTGFLWDAGFEVRFYVEI